MLHKNNTVYNLFFFIIIFFISIIKSQETEMFSVFGDLIVENRVDQISIQFQYGISSFDVTTSVFSSGTAQPSNNLALISTGSAANGFAQIQSRANLSYREGHEGYLFFSAGFPNGSAINSTQWIGLFDAVDGFAVGYNGTAFSILYRNNGVSTTIPQASFNGDPLNGTGSSGFTLNPANLNAFRLAYGWLGASPLLFQILDQNGEWITFHTIIRSNLFSIPSFTNPDLSITAQVTGAANLAITTASWSGGSVIETPFSPGQRNFTAGRSTTETLNAAGAETHLLTIQNKSLFQGKINKIKVIITFVSAGSSPLISMASIMRLRKNATVTGTAFTDVNTANSVVQSSQSGVYTAGTGGLLIAFGNDTFGSGPIDLLIKQKNLSIYLYPGETLTITGQSLSGGGNTAFASLAWLEDF